MYLMRKGTDLKDAVVFSYRTSFSQLLGITNLDASKGGETKDEKSNLKMDDGYDPDE